MWENERKTSVVIVDDHPIVIQGIKALVQQAHDLHFAGYFENGKSFLEFLGQNKTDVVLLDITLPDLNGLELCREVRKMAPETRIIALSNHSERSIITQMIQNGAAGYLLKNASAEEITSCIHDVLSGKVAFSREVNEILARHSTDAVGVPELTRREKEILQLIAQGQTSNEIAEKLFISPFTVETHRRNLMQKFEVKNVVSLIRVATDCGFIVNV
ncbi:MAG: response regulator transcription factor [Mucilaginibacter polytrichastri]|nr:response regulator transcription factor [Mucilaginibacter polytrichastri]